MQGVNVVARPLDANGNPLYQYTVTFVSGSYFNGNHGNPVTGWTDAERQPADHVGIEWRIDAGLLRPERDAAAAGHDDGELSDHLRGQSIPYYILENSVGPYLEGSPEPSGSLPPISVPSMAAGSAQTLTVSAAGSAVGGYNDAIGSEAAPRIMPPAGCGAGG